MLFSKYLIAVATALAIPLDLSIPAGNGLTSVPDQRNHVGEIAGEKGIVCYWHLRSIIKDGPDSATIKIVETISSRNGILPTEVVNYLKAETPSFIEYINTLPEEYIHPICDAAFKFIGGLVNSVKEKVKTVTSEDSSGESREFRAQLIAGLNICNFKLAQ